MVAGVDRDALEARIAETDETIERDGDSPDPVARRRVEQAYLLKGRTLRRLGRYEDALPCLEHVIEGAGELPVRDDVASAMECKAGALFKLGRFDEVGDVVSGMVERFGEASEPQVRLWVGLALFHRAHALRGAGRPAEAAVVFGTLIERLRTEPALNAETARLLTAAMLAKAGALAVALDIDGALVAVDEIIQRFGGEDDDRDDEAVAEALFLKGTLLVGERDRAEHSLPVYDALLDRFVGSVVMQRGANLAKVMSRRARVLLALGRPREAEDAYDAVRSRFANDERPEVGRYVADALAHQSDLLARRGLEVESRRVLNELLQRFGSATDEKTRGAVMHAKRILLNTDRRALARQRERAAIAAVVYVLGLASLIAGLAVASPPSALRAVGVAVSIAGLLLVIGVQIRAGLRVRSASARYGLGNAARAEYEPVGRVVAFLAGAVAIVGGGLIAWV